MSQMRSVGTLKPADWICADGSDRVMRASDEPLLVPIFDGRIRRGRSLKACPHCRMSLIRKRYEGVDVLHCAFCGGYLLKPDVLNRLVARRDQLFTKNEIDQARLWRARRRGKEQPVDGLPKVNCPACGTKMYKSLHSLLTAVVIDRCQSPACRAIWCSSGALEKIQILIEDTET